MDNNTNHKIEINSHTSDPFFAEPVDPRKEARAMALEVITHLLLWMSDSPTLENRGLRVMVALWCVRPDLIGGITLEEIGEQTGCTRQAVCKLADDFRKSMGLVVSSSSSS